MWAHPHQVCISYLGFYIDPLATPARVALGMLTVLVVSTLQRGRGARAHASGPMLCMPDGVVLRSAKPPPPSYFSMTLPRASGSPLQLACLQFYEPVSTASGARSELLSALLAPNAPLYALKCVCVGSAWPLTALWREYLDTLLKLRLSRDSSFRNYTCPLPVQES